MSSNKQWATKEVAVQHGYLSPPSQPLPSHVAAIQAIKPTILQLHKPDSKYFTIYDLGCGNGRMILALREVLGSSFPLHYVGFDFNEACLEEAKKTFPEFWFEQMDLDEYGHTMKDTDLIILDSTLSMVERPKELLLGLLKNNRAVLVERIRVGEKTVREEYLWGGMTQPSVNWAFHPSFFFDVANESGCMIAHKSDTRILFVNEEKDEE